MEEADIRQTGGTMDRPVDTTDRPTEWDLVKPIWKAIRGHLENIKSPIYEQLRNYPQPIAACDLQYERLSEERDGISRELGRLDAACRETVARRDHIKAIDEFIRSSTYIDDKAERKIRADLKEEFSDLNVFLETGRLRRPAAWFGEDEQE